MDLRNLFWNAGGIDSSVNTCEGWIRNGSERGETNNIATLLPVTGA